MNTRATRSILALVALTSACSGVSKPEDDTDSSDLCLPSRVSLDRADATWTGADSKDHMGETVIGDHDLSGDGKPDLVTASSTASHNGTFSGRVSIDYGPITEDRNLSTAKATVTGADEYSYFGASIWVDDFNHDSYAELLIGAHGADDDDGAGYVFFGPTTGELTSDEADVTFKGGYEQAYAGTSLVGGGDFDLDGNGDMVIGAPGVDVYDIHGVIYTGAVITYRGAIAPGAYALDDYYSFFYAEQSNDGVGTEMAMDDLDGDGGADLVIGAQEYYRSGTRIGKVYVVYAPYEYNVPDTKLSDIDAGVVGTSLHDRPGTAIATPGDVNGDGYGDLFLGVQYGESDTGEAGGSNEGAAILLYGPVKTERTDAQADATFIGEAAGDYAGTSVAAPGDINGDDNVDVIIGAPGNDDAGTDAGKAYLLYGPLTGTYTLDSADVAFEGGATDHAGTAVSGAGDMNADGFADLLVGSPGDPGTATPGTVSLINGCAR